MHPNLWTLCELLAEIRAQDHPPFDRAAPQASRREVVRWVDDVVVSLDGSPRGPRPDSRHSRRVRAARREAWPR